MAAEDPRAEVAARLRAVADRLARAEATGTAGLDDAAARLEQVVDLVGPADGPSSFAVASARRRDEGVAGWPPHPLGAGACGSFPPFSWDASDDAAVATITFGPAFEGPPGTVHGGFVAAAFDMVVSSVATRALGQAVTRSLAVRYLRPTPLGVELRFDAQVGEVVGRLAPVVARCRLPGGRLTAKAEGQLASVPAERFGRPVAADPDRRTDGPGGS